MKTLLATQGPQGCLLLLLLRQAFGMNLRSWEQQNLQVQGQGITGPQLFWAQRRWKVGVRKRELSTGWRGTIRGRTGTWGWDGKRQGQEGV